MADLPLDESVEVTIRDATDQTRELLVTTDGSIYTSPTVSKWIAEGKGFIANSALTFAGTTFEDKILFRNPSGSGKTVIILGFILHLDLAATTSQLNQITVRLYKAPTVSANGGGIAENNLNTGGSDTSVSLVNDNPTITDNGVKIGEGSAINGSYSTPLPFVMVANTTLLARIKTNVAANGVIFTIAWVEL